jgi:serine phosphatase RsbU (regulator of sigma subunit)
MTVESPGEHISHSLVMEPVPDSVRMARRFVANVLADERWDSIRDVAILLTSELVTNALVHSASPVDMTVSVANGAVVQVRDADTGPLMAGGPTTELGEGGRGILLVNSLSEAWGTEHSGGRKVVWFRLRPATEETSAEDRIKPIDQKARKEALQALVTERRLSLLVLPAELERNLSGLQQATEILSRTVTALDANGAVLDAGPALGERVLSGRPHGQPHQLVLDVGGHAFGDLTLFVDRVLDAEEEAFLRVAAERLALTVAGNSLVTATRRREAGSQLLIEASELLAGSTTVAHVLSLSTQVVVPDLAEWCVAYEVDERRRPRRVTAAHVEEARLDTLFDFLERDSELNRVMLEACIGNRSGSTLKSVFVDSRRYYPVVIPLASPRHITGLLILGRLEPTDPSVHFATVELGRRIGLALENARLHEQVAAAAQALQASLLPRTLPRVDHLELAAQYYAATPALAVGGDFYDAFSLADGSAILAVGDVCGKGATAAAVTRTSRDVLRLLINEGWSISNALRRLNIVLLEQNDPELFSTIALAHFQPINGRVGRFSICLAGHPKPALIRSSGTVELVGSPGGLLGILPDNLLRLEEAEVAVESGDTLLLYTDGVTEARQGRELFGQSRLTALLTGMEARSPQRLADAVRDAASRFSSGELHDDLAVLVARASWDASTNADSLRQD